MDAVPDEQLTIITNAECPFFFLATCFLNPYASAIAIVMAFAVYRQMNNQQQTNQLATKFMMISILCSIIFYLNSIFLTNTLLIPWDFSALNFELSEISDGISCFSWISGKICFYWALCIQISQQFMIVENAVCFKISIPYSYFLCLCLCL